jgi:hypothetical protein
MPTALLPHASARSCVTTQSPKSIRPVLSRLGVAHEIAAERHHHDGAGQQQAQQ